LFDIISEDEMPDMQEVGVDMQTVDGKYPEIIMAGARTKMPDIFV